MHCPPSLRAYVHGLKPRKQIILVLTKADLVDPRALEGWKSWMRDWWGPEVHVVSVMSYDVAMLRGGEFEPPKLISSFSRSLGLFTCQSVGASKRSSHLTPS
jgi:hypothetical protein